MRGVGGALAQKTMETESTGTSPALETSPLSHDTTPTGMTAGGLRLLGQELQEPRFPVQDAQH